MTQILSLSTRLAVAALLALGPVPAFARDFVIAPLGAALSGAADGSPDKPFVSISAAYDQAGFQAGDRYLLMDGTHGSIEIAGWNDGVPLVIAAAPGARPQVDYIAVKDSRNVQFSNLAVVPRTPTGKQALVATTQNTSDITFSGLTVMSRPDANAKYLDWPLEDWSSAWTVNGVMLDGTRNVLTDSVIIGTGAAITTSGPGARVLRNRVSGFSADAMRGLGDDTVFSFNTVENCIKIDGNHDDGFQAWSPRGRSAAGRTELNGLTLEGNRILEWTGPANHPLRCTLQGIGLFDGPFRNVRIVNNLVAVSAYHGITISGGHNVQIINNTVVARDPNSRDNFPWIMVADNKDGSPASGIAIVNNVAMGFRDDRAHPDLQLQRINAPVSSLTQFFANPATLDFRPRPGGALIDAGDTGTGPDVDIDGNARPIGRASDLGAFEGR